MSSAYVGGRIRQLREDHKINQVEFAAALGISPSYLNQLEHNSRPLTVPVLLKITETFGVDSSFFAPNDTSRLIAELQEALASEPGENPPTLREITDVASAQPRIAQAFIDLHRRYVNSVEELNAGESAPLMPHEQVRDFFYRHPYLHEVDIQAEQVAIELDARGRDLLGALRLRLKTKHGIRVVMHDEDSPGVLHRYVEDARVLTLSTHLRPDQQAFRIARQLALVEIPQLLSDLTDDAGVIGDDARALTTIGLANYFAAALLLPYAAFRSAAEGARYDIERLSRAFEVGFETVCHRLSTLQRPRMRGVPFSFVRVDRAGNVSKRLSATPFAFSRSGATCPLWNVYEAFAAPGRILTQVASMPDGHRYLWVARTVTRAPGRYGQPTKTFAIGLGCETKHASRLVYSAGLNLADEESATPIGMGCRVCDRIACAQRAFPPLGRRLTVDEDRSTFVPYPFADQDDRSRSTARS